MTIPEYDECDCGKRGHHEQCAGTTASVSTEFTGSASVRCAFCGYVWQKGKDGSHSCAKQLRGMILSIQRVANGEDQVADDDTGGLKWIADYISTILD